MPYSTSIKCRKLGRLLLSTILASGAATQAMATTPREYRNLDPNGVDLTHGDAVISVVEGSIGSGEGELTLVRNQVATGDGTIHIGYGPHQWDGITLLRTPVAGGAIVTSINKDNRFESFAAPGTLATGSTLSGSGQQYEYRTSDGTTIIFSDPGGHTYGPSTFCNGSDGQTSCVLPPSSITTPDGKTTNITYDLWSGCDSPQVPDEPFACYFWTRIASVSNNSGYRIAFSYASQGSGGTTSPPPNTWQRRTGATFYNDNIGSSAVASTSYSYPGGDVVNVTDTAGQVWRISGNYLNITGVRRPGASSDTTSISYSSNQVTSVTRDGVTTGYSRSVSGSTATMTVTNALSQTSTVVSNLTIGRPTSVTDALSRTTTYQYDGSIRPTEVTYPEGNKAQLAYDARGNITSTTMKAKSGSGLADIVTTASYPSSCTNPVTCNSPDWTRDAKGNQTDYTYDATHGGVLTVTAPADASGVRPQSRYSYTLANGVYLLTGTSVCTASASCAGTAGEVTTSVAYNSNRLPTSVTIAAGNASLATTATATYDASGNLKTVDGPLSGTGDTTTYRYDSGRRLLGVVGPDPDGTGSRKPTAQRLAYNSSGLLATRETGIVDDAGDTAWAGFSSQEQVALTYDANARPVKSELKSGSTTFVLTQTSYDGLGRVQCTATRMNPAVFTSLPSSACSLGTQGAGAGDFGPDRIIKKTYDAAGQVTKVQTAYGATEQADEVTTAYTNNGRVDYVIDAEANRTNYTFDGHDRPVITEYPVSTKGANASNGSDYEQLTFDANGNVTSRRLRDGNSIGYGYDNLNRLTSKDLPGSEPDATYSYDLLSRPLSAVQNGQTLNFTHDALGRNLTQSGPLGTVTYTYDAAGRRTGVVYPGGTSLTVGYDYDATGQVTAIKENGSTTLTTYAYDNLGRRTSATFGNGVVQSFAYDAVSRLATLSSDLAGTGYDQTATFGYNPASQIDTLSKSNDAYAWGGHYNVDRVSAGNGLNQFTAATPSSGQTSVPTLGYDARGNLTSSGSSSFAYSSENFLKTGPSATLDYDPVGRLYQTVGSITTRFQYDGADLIAEYNGSNGLQRRYVHGPNTDNPILWYEGTGLTDKRYLTTDERGSVVAVSNGSGTVTNINNYDEFGIPASANVGRFQYTGQIWLPELGLYYYKARIYSPTLGRFMQTDPTGYSDGINWYNYVKGDPVNYSDPTGLDSDNSVEEIRVTGSKIIKNDCGGVCGNAGPNIFAIGSIGNFNGNDSLGGIGYDEIVVLAADEHTKNKRPSTKGKHERGDARRGRDAGGEKADKERRPPRKRPDGWRGPYPPKTFLPLFIPTWLLDMCGPGTIYKDPSCGPLIASIDLEDSDG